MIGILIPFIVGVIVAFWALRPKKINYLHHWDRHEYMDKDSP